MGVRMPDYPQKKKVVSTPAPDQRWMRIDAGARYMGRSVQYVRNLIHAGKLRVSKPDSQYLLDRNDVDEFLIRHKRIAPPYRRGTRPAVALRHARKRKAGAR